MRRITSTDAAQDLHSDIFGSGADGFTDGSVIDATPATHLNADWFNNVQEELCSAVVGSGGSLMPEGTDYFFQLDDAIQASSPVHGGGTVNHVVTGLVFNIAGTSLTVSLSSGTIVYGRRRYVITDAKLAAASATSFLLTASRDTYFFIGPVDIGVAEDALNRNLVYVTSVAVTNGAAAPSTPAGTFLFAMVVTSGSDATTVTYYNRGPRMIDENGVFVALRPSGQVNTRASFHPGASPTPVDLGYPVADSQEGYWSRIYVEERHLRSAISSLFTYADDYEFTFNMSVGVGAVVDTAFAILDADDWPDGTTALVEIRCIGIDPTDPTDGYSATLQAHVHKDGSTWDMDGSGVSGDAVVRGSNGATAAGVSIRFHLNGGSDQLLFEITGHNTDAMRFFNVCRVTMLGN